MNRSFMVNPLSYFSFQPVLYYWCNKGRGMCYPVCGMMHIKELLMLIERVAYVAAACFLSLSEWSFTICLTPYNRKQNVLSSSLNKTLPSFLLSNRRDGESSVCIREYRCTGEGGSSASLSGYRSSRPDVVLGLQDLA